MAIFTFATPHATWLRIEECDLSTCNHTKESLFHVVVRAQNHDRARVIFMSAPFASFADAAAFTKDFMADYLDMIYAR